MNDCLNRHAQAYVLGNKLVASKFKKQLIRSLHSFMWRHAEQVIDMSILIEAAKVVYDGTSTEDGWEMRTLLALYCVQRAWDMPNRPHTPLENPETEMPGLWTTESC